MWKITKALVSFEKNMANRKARKIAHKQNELNFLARKNEINSPEFSGEKIDKVDEVPTISKTVTKKVNAKVANTKRMSQSKVSKKYKNAKGEDKIGFEKNTLNNFSHAKTGDVDGKFTAFAELSEWLVVSPNPKNKKENRIFFNFVEEELKKDFIKVAKREGFEVSFN
jgi:hypothetical protein